MKPFEIVESMSALKSHYPDARTLINAAYKGGWQARVAIAQLWLTEGIPFAFSECPALYDSIRSWLSTKLDVHAKEISIVGSARLGESLNPKKIGTPFNSASDLDLLVVSGSLFNQLQNEFNVWSNDYESGVIKPRHDPEKSYWMDNKKRGPKIIDRGFIDAKMIPYWNRYQMSQRTANYMWQLVEKLKSTANSPKPQKASIRCYKNWSSLIKRISFNLHCLVDPPR